MRQTGAFGRLFLLGLLLVGMPAAADSCLLPSGLEHAEVRRVVDGDTLQLKDGSRVRIIGLDAPELGRNGAPDEPLAREALTHLQQLIQLAENAVLLQTGAEPRDRYGRRLTRVFTERHGDLAAHLIRNGLALQAIVPPNLQGVACHREAEKEARAQNRGLWALQGGAVVASDQLSSTGFAIVRGRTGVWQARRDDHLLRLEGGLVLRFRNDDLARWFDGIALDGYANARIEVRGWVHPWGRGGRAMTVQHPATIEIILN